MEPQDDPTPTRSLQEWVSWFQDGIAPPDLDEAGIRSFLKHFADLGILEPAGEERWRLSGLDAARPTEELRKQVVGRLESLSRTESGFAVACFLGRPAVPPSSRSAPPEPEQQKDGGGGLFGKRGSRGNETVSDLSNLQIVKKLGRQLKPLLDLEKRIMDRLPGKHTTPEDAKRIYNYLLSKGMQKASPRQWEQLSRKRHK